MIIPRIKQEIMFDKHVALPEAIRYFAAEDFGKKAAALLALFIPDVSFVSVNTRSEADFVFECRFNVSQKAEFYKIMSAKTPITVNYRDFAGARNAVATISQLISENADGGYDFPSAEIYDYPDNKMRSLMIDPARGLIPVKTVEEILIRMAMAKYNYMHLHLSDSKGYAIKSSVVEYGGPNGEQYTKAQIRHIVEFAASLGIECIPEIDVPAHSTQLLAEMPQLACVTDGSEEPSPWVVCAGNEQVYELYEKLFTELAELFPCRLMHVGTDEIEMNDLTERRTWPTWHCCRRCRELCEREGIDRNSRTEIFYYMLRRIYAITGKLGKRLMMWNDNIDISKVPELPRDILIHFWRVAGKNRGPVEGCSMQRFLEEGFEVFNSYYPETYIEGGFYYNKDETIRVWTPYATPEHDHAYDEQILGGEPCAWDSHEHFKWTLPSSIMLFGDRFWNNAVCDDMKAFGIAGTRWQLGLHTPAGFDIFEPFGGFMQPRSDDGARMWTERAAADLSAVDSELAKLENRFTLSGRLAGIYRENIKWLEESRKS